MKNLSIRKVVIPYLLALALFLMLKDWEKIKSSFQLDIEINEQELHTEN